MQAFEAMAMTFGDGEDDPKESFPTGARHSFLSALQFFGAAGF